MLRIVGVWLLTLVGIVGVVEVEAAIGPGLAVQQEQRESEDRRIDVNEASEEELQKVPGIGPAMAQRIVEWRQQHGRFERLDDLLNVRGIGTRTLEKLRAHLRVTAAEGHR